MGEVKDKLVTVESVRDVYDLLNNKIYNHNSDKDNPHGTTLKQLGVNASVDELNYMSGVTSGVQSQLDALSSSKAPSGYGLGNISVKVFSDKTGLDTLTESGFYTIHLDKGDFLAEDYWFMFGLVTVDAYNNENCIQKAKSVQLECILQRICIDGAWTEWEWLNPLMTIGVEYRTAERYDGKAVYVKLVSLGELPDVGSKDVVALTSGTNVIDYEITTIRKDGTVVTKLPIFSTDGSVNCVAAYSAVSYSIKVVTFTNMSGCTAVAKIKYTKD